MEHLPKSMVLDLGFLAGFWNSRTITGNQISSNIDGRYETKDWYVGHISFG